jgi:hypothetical protein
MKPVVKYGVYQDILLRVSIYLTKCRFLRENPKMDPPVQQHRRERERGRERGRARKILSDLLTNWTASTATPKPETLRRVALDCRAGAWLLSIVTHSGMRSQRNRFSTL